MGQEQFFSMNSGGQGEGIPGKVEWMSTPGDVALLGESKYEWHPQTKKYTSGPWWD